MLEHRLTEMCGDRDAVDRGHLVVDAPKPKAVVDERDADRGMDLEGVEQRQRLGCRLLETLTFFQLVRRRRLSCASWKRAIAWSIAYGSWVR